MDRLAKNVHATLVRPHVSDIMDLVHIKGAQTAVCVRFEARGHTGFLSGQTLFTTCVMTINASQTGKKCPPRDFTMITIERKVLDFVARTWNVEQVNHRVLSDAV